MGRPEVVNSTTTTPSDHHPEYHQQQPGDHMQPPHHQMPPESHDFQQPQTPLSMPTRPPPQPPRHPHAQNPPPPPPSHDAYLPTQQQQQEVVYPPTNPQAAAANNPHQPYPPPPPSTPPHHQANPVLPHQAGYVPPQPVQFPPASSDAMNNNNIHDPHRMNPPNIGSPYHYQQNGGNGTSTTTGIPLQQHGRHHQNQTYPNYATATSTYGVANRPIGTVGWTTGLFDCMEDPTNAAVTAIFPCLTFGQIAEVIDEGHTTCGTSGIIYGAMGFLIGLPCLLSCTYRTKLRNKYELVEAPAPDWVSHFFCEWCALCQEYRELRNRGLDPSLGWHGNQMKIKSMQQQPQVLMTSPMNQTMG